MGIGRLWDIVDNSPGLRVGGELSKFSGKIDCVLDSVLCGVVAMCVRLSDDSVHM